MTLAARTATDVTWQPKHQWSPRLSFYTYKVWNSLTEGVVSFSRAPGNVCSRARHHRRRAGSMSPPCSSVRSARLGRWSKVSRFLDCASMNFYEAFGYQSESKLLPLFTRASATDRGIWRISRVIVATEVYLGHLVRVLNWVTITPAVYPIIRGAMRRRQVGLYTRPTAQYTSNERLR